MLYTYTRKYIIHITLQYIALHYITYIYASMHAHIHVYSTPGTQTHTHNTYIYIGRKLGVPRKQIAI